MSRRPSPREAAIAEVARIRHLPTLSASATRLLAAVGRDDADLSTLVGIIESDVALTARVLKVANSPYYGYDRSIDGIDRAVVLLGLGVVRNVAVAASLDPMFRGGRITTGFHIGELWQQSLAAAVIAEHIARQRAPALGPVAFLGGLLHEVGWLVHLQRDPHGLAELIGMCEQAPHPSTAALLRTEQERFGAGHDELGAALLRHWHLPEHVCAAVATHHDIAPMTSEGELGGIVHSADELARRLGFGTCLEPGPDDSAGSEAETAKLLELVQERLSAMDMRREPVIQRQATAM